MRKHLTILTFGCILLLAGCSNRYTWHVFDPCMDPRLTAKGLPVTAYTTTDGVRHPCDGWAATYSSQSITFTDASGAGKPAGLPSFVLPFHDLQSVVYSRSNQAANSFWAGTFTALVAWAIVLAANE